MASSVASPVASGGTAVPVRTVLGLGDSVTAGSACGCVDFVRLLAHDLTAVTGHEVTATNRGRAGQTSTQLLALVRGDAGTRADVRAADADVITIGANDFAPALKAWDAGACDDACAQHDVAAVTSRVADVVRVVRALRAGRPTRVVVTDYWNVFADGAVGRDERGAAYLAWSDRLTRAFNAALCPEVTAAGASCLDLYAPFKGPDGHRDPTGLLADDGDHPNAAGHALIARLVLAQLTTPSG
ncbi:MAG TPA: SGNH/GDSL hydrolase family protein [Angustibacter sp.]|nr:SGNH/GDSL hydrolase family protein [Angustibacter sp.]